MIHTPFKSPVLMVIKRFQSCKTITTISVRTFPSRHPHEKLSSLVVMLQPPPLVSTHLIPVCRFADSYRNGALRHCRALSEAPLGLLLHGAGQGLFWKHSRGTWRPQGLMAKNWDSGATLPGPCMSELQDPLASVSSSIRRGCERHSN